MLNTPLFPCPQVLFKSCCINTLLLKIHLWSFKTQPSCCEGKNTGSLFVSLLQLHAVYANVQFIKFRLLLVKEFGINRSLRY